MFVPEFEVERTRAEASFDGDRVYPEYPGIEHPMPIFARVLDDLGIRTRSVRTSDGYPGILGYQGPDSRAVTGAGFARLGDVVERMMTRKSATEIELIRESGRWCSYAHRLLQEYSRPGATEAEASLRAGQEATLAMLQELGESYGGGLSSSDGVSAGYRGQIGLRSSWAAHAVAHNIEFRPGDVLVTETSAPIWGYNAELERALIVGEPTDEMRHALRSRRRGPASRDRRDPTAGATCADVDGAVMQYFEGNDLVRAPAPATASACATTRRRSSMSVTTRRSSPGWSSRSSRVSTTRRSAASATPTPSSSPRTVSSLTDYPIDIESLTLPA